MIFHRVDAVERGVCMCPCLFRSIARRRISALLSVPCRNHCPCTAIRQDRTSHCFLQRGRTGSSALWLCRSHCLGIGSQKGRRFHCSPLLGTFGSPEQEKSGVIGLLRRPEHIGLIGRGPKKLIPRNRLQHSQFQRTKLLRTILRNTERVSVDFTP